MNYKHSGVDTQKATELISKLREKISETYNTPHGRVTSEYGGFAGVFHLEAGGIDLVATSDGVGTKIELYKNVGSFEGIGQDLVAMCVNDLYCAGATPLFFLDYIACGHLDESWYQPVITDIARACKQSGMALLGGETAEHPGVLSKDQFDLSGFCVGIVKSESFPKIRNLREGDLLLGIPSSGLHSNGFSLIRKLIAEKNFKSQFLLKPTRIYNELPSLYGHIKAACHITGGGVYENLPRILPDHLSARLNNWPEPSGIFEEILHYVEIQDARRVFNMGVGMILVIDPNEFDYLIEKIPDAKLVGQLEIHQQYPVLF